MIGRVSRLRLTQLTTVRCNNASGRQAGYSHYYSLQAVRECHVGHASRESRRLDYTIFSIVR